MGIETASARSDETSSTDNSCNRYDPDTAFQLVQCCECGKVVLPYDANKGGWLVGIAGNMCNECQLLNLPW